MVQLPEATSLKKTDSPSLGSHWLTVAPLLGEEPLPSWCCSVAWIFFCRQARLPGLEPLSSTSYNQKTLFLCSASGHLTSDSHHLSDLLSMMVPQPWGEAVWHGCLFCGWVLHRHVFSALWPAVGFCINLHPLRKATSQMRSECCSNLQYRDTNLEGSLILCQFSTIRLLGSPMEPGVPNHAFLIKYTIMWFLLWGRA